MGKRGPQPKPTALRVLQGNPSHKKKTTAEEPKPRPLAPEPPVWLNKEAIAVWNDLAPKLEPLGLLTEVDLLDFANLCVAAAHVRKCSKRVDRGMTAVVGKNGYRAAVSGQVFCTNFGQQLYTT